MNPGWSDDTDPLNTARAAELTSLRRLVIRHPMDTPKV